MSTDWSLVEIGDKPAAVYDPGPDAPPYALIWLHDEDGTLPAALLPELQARRLRCAAPLAPDCWWVDRVCPSFNSVRTPERHLLESVRPWLLAAGARGVAVAGIGMGGQGAVRLGLRYPSLFPVVAALDGAFDFHERWGQGTALDEMYPSREHARRDTAVLHVSGTDWPSHLWLACAPDSPWYRGNDRLHEKLAAVGVPHTADLDTVADPSDRLAEMLDGVLAGLRRPAWRLL